jgi:hypothetical protein
MKRITRFRKRTWVLFGVIAAIAAMASVGAYAYWTTTGAGTGSASTGNNSALVLHGSASPALYPGSSSTVSFTVDNSSPGSQYLGTIQFTGIDPVSGCVAGDFTMPDVVANQNIPSGNGNAVTAQGTLSYADNGNQDGCKNKSITLNFTSN